MILIRELIFNLFIFVFLKEFSIADEEWGESSREAGYCLPMPIPRNIWYIVIYYINKSWHLVNLFIKDFYIELLIILLKIIYSCCVKSKKKYFKII